jgi:catechol 2,3-dioxygenase-like lactoylglutathione lyase family enzyme
MDGSSVTQPRSPGVRAIDHVGITVPSIPEASAFLVAALGAEVVYDMRPEVPSTSDPGPDDQARLGVRAGVRWKSSRLLRLGEGASIELFEYDDAQQRTPPTVSDLGIQHFAVYVDDIHAARDRIVAEGGTALEGPLLLPGPEEGDGNWWLYTVAPWGGIIELVSYPTRQAYEATATTRRWRPAPSVRNPATTQESDR